MSLKLAAAQSITALPCPPHTCQVLFPLLSHGQMYGHDNSNHGGISVLEVFERAVRHVLRVRNNSDATNSITHLRTHHSEYTSAKTAANPNPAPHPAFQYERHSSAARALQHKEQKRHYRETTTFIDQS